MAVHAPITGAPTRAPDIRPIVRRFLRTHDITASRFGRDAVKDPAFVHDLLHRGRDVRPATAKRIIAYIASVEGHAASNHGEAGNA